MCHTKNPILGPILTDFCRFLSIFANIINFHGRSMFDIEEIVISGQVLFDFISDFDKLLMIFVQKLVSM